MVTVPPLGHDTAALVDGSHPFGFLAASMRNVGTDQGGPTGYEVMQWAAAICGSQSLCISTAPARCGPYGAARRRGAQPPLCRQARKCACTEMASTWRGRD